MAVPGLKAPALTVEPTHVPATRTFSARPQPNRPGRVISRGKAAPVKR